jgi:hypothetical protein
MWQKRCSHHSVSVYAVKDMLGHELQDHKMFQRQMRHILDQLQLVKDHLGIKHEGGQFSDHTEVKEDA